MRRTATAMLLLLTLLSSCVRRSLFEEYAEVADLTVTVDWSRTPLDPEGVTVAFYPSDGGAPTRYFSNGDTVAASVPKGTYSIIVFNESVTDFDNLLFRDVQSAGRFSAFTAAERGVSYTTVASPEMLASWNDPAFTVDDELVRISRLKRAGRAKTEDVEKHLHVHAVPRLLTATVNLTVHVTGAGSMVSAGGYLGNLADAVRVADGLPSDGGGCFKVSFGSPVPAGGDECALSASFHVFGTRSGETAPESDYWFDFRASLKDGFGFRQKVNVVPHMEVREGVWGEQVIDIEIGPLALPEVEGQGGWQVDLGEWEGVNVTVPVE